MCDRVYVSVGYNIIDIFRFGEKTVEDMVRVVAYLAEKNSCSSQSSLSSSRVLSGTLSYH